MRVSTNTFAEMTSYLHDLEKIIPTAPLHKKIYTEGTLLHQIAFHIMQSANYYLRFYVLNENFIRDREAEFTANHSVNDILNSLQSVLDASAAIVKSDITLTAPLQKTKMIQSRGFVITTVSETLQHVTAHTAEHYGEIMHALKRP